MVGLRSEMLLPCTAAIISSTALFIRHFRLNSEAIDALILNRI